jgi:hypothetical protein
MPNYVPAMLSRLCPSECVSATSPATYTPPVPYPDTSSLSTLITLVSPAEKTWIQQVVGSLLFYARALDLSVFTAVCQFSSHQSNPTQHDLSAAHRLLNYVSSHRNPQKTIHPSSMALWACTDASFFLSRPNSGNVAGCSVGLGEPPPYLLNPPSQKATDRVPRPNRPLSVLPAFFNPTPLSPYPPLLPTTLPSMPTASAYPWGW